MNIKDNNAHKIANSSYPTSQYGTLRKDKVDLVPKHFTVKAYRRNVVKAPMTPDGGK
jgi:hypothetical protein